MKFIEGYCPHCKKELQINQEKETSVCPFCGMEYIVKDAIDCKEIIKNENREQNMEKSEKEKIIKNRKPSKLKYIGIIGLISVLIIIYFQFANIASLLITISKYIMVILLVCGIFKLICAFKNYDCEQKYKATTFILSCGIIISTLSLF